MRLIKSISAATMLLGAFSFGFTSCDKNNHTPDEPQENISVEELKLGEKDIPDSGIAFAYGHLSIQAKIKVLEGTIASIKMTAQQEDGGQGKFDETELISGYDKETGELKALIPADDYEQLPMDQPVGQYKMNLVITLDNGESKAVTGQFQISDKPFLENFEMGSGHGAEEVNNHTGSLKTGDLHVEADVYCVMNQLKRITVLITSKDGKTEVVNQTWDKSPYAGTRNTTFHEHPKFPEGTKPGEYLFKFTAEDKEGNTCTREYNLTLVNG